MDGLAFVQMVEVELKKRGISKEQFYRESGVSSATMSQWRKRIYSPSSAAIKKIEDYFGVEFSITQNEKSPDQHVLTEGEAKLIELFRKVPEDRQAMVIQMIEAALKNL